MVANTMSHRCEIDAPAERVWATLTAPAFLGRWFGGGAPAELDLRPGGRLLFGHHTTHGTLLARIGTVQPAHRLTFHWAPGPAGAEPGAAATLVELTLTERAGRTRLEVTESGFAGLDVPAEELAARYSANDAGWPRKLAEVRDEAEAPRA
ncbi:SRPBCC domain-containing protein [Actinoplanes oblitus]|uniref:SRPBCC domain-containing protein n=1 Tax=Actinoplanes oblitus TaxID=3040509 RepID=A0ABY8WP92_9ACTN|nr:SRPBCC domain-containing protein [Actinoplanes oblitus]WIM99670.1 SRPBCC domain-containing protein [Actinoplanes oblitus]